MADIYKIGVEIALAGTITQGLAAISSSLLGIHTKVKEIEGGFTRWGVAIGGVAAIFTSGAIFKGMEHAVQAGGELVKQQTLLRNMGVSQAEVLETTAKAQLATHQVIGTTIAENVKGMRELMGVMPSLKEAQTAFPAVMQAAKVLESLTGTPASQNMQVLAKAIELRGGGMNATTGQLDPERFVREAEAATRAIVASGGLVNARSLYQYMQTAGPMARMMTDPDKFYKSMLTALMDMGGFRAGTAMTAAGRQLLGGKMTKPTAEEMENLGLLNPGSWHASGVGVFVDKGGLRGEDILKDPKQGMLDWATRILLPALAAKGVTAAADVQQELYRVFGTETARRMMGLFIQNQSQIKRDASLYDNALPDTYGNLAKGDLGANVTNLKDAVANFLQAFGAPMVPVAINALQTMSSAMNSIAAGALAHPEMAKAVGEGLIALSAGLAALGTAAIAGAALAFAPGGAIAIGILGIGASVTALAAMNWSGVKAVLQGIVDAINAFIAGISGLAGKIGAAIEHMIPGSLGGQGKEPPAFPNHPSTVPTPAFPGSGKQGMNTGHVYLDGTKVGSVIWRNTANQTAFSTSAPAFDTYGHYVGADNAFATG